MADKQKNPNVFALFAAEQRAADTTEYYPYGIGKQPEERQEWFRVHYPDGAIEMLPYRALQKVACPSEERVELHLADGVIALTGRYLSGMLALIQDAQLRSLYPFERTYFAEPPEGEPVITQIVRHDREDR